MVDLATDKRLNRHTHCWPAGLQCVTVLYVLVLWLTGPCCARAQVLPPEGRSLSPALAQPLTRDGSGTGAASATLADALSRPGDLTLRNSSLNAALLTISELWGINVVAGEVPGSVNGVFKDAPLREILDSILISNGYGYRAVGESLVVSSLDNLGQVNPFFESATIPVGAAKIEDVVSGAALLSTPQGQIRPIPSAGSIFVLDFPDRVRMIRQFVATVDAAARRAAGGAPLGEGPQELQVAYLKTHYINSQSAADMLQAILSPAGRVAAMPDEDRLLVVDYAQNLQMAGTVLQRIDQPRPQVSVRALIYDISLADMEEVGINWQSLSGGNGTTTFDNGSLSVGTVTSGGGALVNSVTQVPFTEGSAGGSFTFFTLNNNFNLAAVASALQNATDSRLLASPNVTVVDNDEATIESVEEVPFQQLTQTAAGGNIGTTAFREAGITLRVRPKIAMDGTIEMDVQPEFSRLTGFTPGDNQPIIDRRTARTRVRITNGQTFVIAGLRQRSDVGDFKGIPLLKDVRFFGHLFRARETEIRESELVVFINPTIVGYNEYMTARDRAVADTINCRLAGIPCAEGCPQGCACPSSIVSVEPAADPVQVHPSLPTPVGPEALPTDAGASVRRRPQPSNDSILPLPSDDDSEELAYPVLSHRSKLRRLPPVAGPATQVATRRAPRTAQAGSMRPRYDARFQANSRPDPQPSEQTDQAPTRDESQGFWGRLFR